MICHDLDTGFSATFEGLSLVLNESTFLQFVSVSNEEDSIFYFNTG